MMTKKIFLCVCLLVILAVPTFSIVWGDYMCKLYPEDCSKENVTILSDNNTGVGDLLHQAGIYMTYANLQFKSFLYCIEENMFSIEKKQEYIETLNNCLDSLSKGQIIYHKVILIPLVFRSDVIQKLKSFNFDELSIQKNESFYIVRSFMEKGDILGIYNKYLDDSNILFFKIKAIQSELVLGITPDINKVYQVNDIFINSERFGMYTSIVLNNI
jgi:hypothetical protein